MAEEARQGFLKILMSLLGHHRSSLGLFNTFSSLSATLLVGFIVKSTVGDLERWNFGMYYCSIRIIVTFRLPAGRIRMRSTDFFLDTGQGV